MQKQKPKELPSFAPMIEDEFMLIRKREKEIDPTKFKQKINRKKREAMRELKKDTMQI